MTKTPEAAEKWANYMRLHRRPQKACWTCKTVYPNTHEHFAAGARGRVGVRCHACVQAHPVPTRVKQHCPCCGAFAALVLDRHAPTAVFICRFCLRMVNDRLTATTQTLNRIDQYVLWRAPQENASVLPGTEARGGR